MDFEDRNKYDIVHSSKVKAGKRRTYFFDVRKTKNNDYYISLTESTKKMHSDGFERHKIFVYKEDFNRFLSQLQETIDMVKNELMPDYDYEQVERRQSEWEAQQNEEQSRNRDEDISW